MIASCIYDRPWGHCCERTIQRYSQQSSIHIHEYNLAHAKSECKCHMVFILKIKEEDVMDC